jgi:signal transduction histidine kinase
VTAYLVISSLLNFLAAGMLGFAVVVRGRKDSINLRFGVFAFITGSWSAAYFFWQLSTDATAALFFTRVLMLFAYFVPVTFFHFVAELCGEKPRWAVRGSYAAAGVLAVLNFTPLMVARVEPAMSFPLWPKAGPLYGLYLLLFGVLTLHAGYLLIKHLRQSDGMRATQLRNILLASIVGFGGGATNFPLWYDIPVPPLGNLLIFLYLMIMAHAVSRYHLPLVAYDFLHATVYLGFSITLAVFHIFIVTLLAPWLGYEITPAFLFTQFLAAQMVCWLFFWLVPKLHRMADRILAQTYLRRRHTQQQQLKELGARLGSIGSEQEIFEHLAPEILRAFNVGAVALYVRSEFDHDYQLRAVRGWTRCPAYQPVDSVATHVFQRDTAPVFLDGSEVRFGPELMRELNTLAERIPFEALFPIASDDFLAGFILLGERAGNERYTQAEIALLESLCLQIAVTLRARQLERRASQADKLIALGTLAAGLAHELRNPLTSVQTFSALLKESRPDPEALQEFSAVVQRDVSRIASIVENVAAFAESNKVEMISVNINDVLRTVLEIIHPELERARVGADLRTAAVPAIKGNHSQLLQVFLNLAQNAVQAMDGREGSRLQLEVSQRTWDVPRPQVCVTVTDNGPGIDPALLPRVFEPFTTTKSTGERRGKHGMGLGLAIVKRIVQHHHGEIHVTSTPGKGTTFVVHLPTGS